MSAPQERRQTLRAGKAIDAIDLPGCRLPRERRSGLAGEYKVP